MVCLYRSTVQYTGNTSMKSVRNTNTLSEHERMISENVQLEVDLARDVKSNEKGFRGEMGDKQTWLMAMLKSSPAGERKQRVFGNKKGWTW